MEGKIWVAERTMLIMRKFRLKCQLIMSKRDSNIELQKYAITLDGIENDDLIIQGLKAYELPSPEETNEF